MSVIYLKHPKHGRKVAISEDEAKFDEKNGWIRYTLDEKPDIAVEPVNKLKRSYTRKNVPAPSESDEGEI